MVEEAVSPAVVSVAEPAVAVVGWVPADRPEVCPFESPQARGALARASRSANARG
ncbi:hypothetical protein [Nannocystis pusilla]|uniref:hypothetical protein n=1 Tax=Nannocystis pusilla TaxID=889268 RepID=UPI003B80E5BB